MQNQTAHVQGRNYHMDVQFEIVRDRFHTVHVTREFVPTTEQHTETLSDS
jgi:hypothetical protein